MSSRKRPLTELRQPPTASRPSRSVPNTPTRYAPSTPHALRALQQQSARKTRSARTIRTLKAADKDVVRPDSARGILRRLAKITAQSQKGIDEGMRALSGAVGVDKENVRPADENDDGEEVMLKKPRLTLDIENEDESLDVDVSELPEGYDDEEDTEELPAVPTPSVLPDDEDDTQDVERGERSVTFKTIDFEKAQRGSGQPLSENPNRRRSRLSIAQLRSEVDQQSDANEEDDPTIMTERGRRAISEEMTGRLSRYSFGSIRMSDFGEDLEVRRESDARFQAKLDHARRSLGASNDVLLEGETELLNSLRSSIPQSPVDDEEDDQGPLIGDGEEDFQLFVPEENDVDVSEEDDVGVPEEHQVEEAAAQQTTSPEQLPQPHHSRSDEVGADLEPPNHQREALSPKRSRRLTILETSALATQTTQRKKRQKMTRHGTMVPSLPASLIKRIATESCNRNGCRRPQLGKDHMLALEQASEWFFEQIGEDLAAYAEHGKRKKKVDARDVMMLMRRQRVDIEGLGRLAGVVLPEDVAAELDLEADDA